MKFCKVKVLFRLLSKCRREFSVRRKFVTSIRLSDLSSFHAAMSKDATIAAVLEFFTFSAMLPEALSSSITSCRNILLPGPLENRTIE